MHTSVPMYHNSGCNHLPQKAQREANSNKSKAYFCTSFKWTVLYYDVSVVSRSSLYLNKILFTLKSTKMIE